MGTSGIEACSGRLPCTFLRRQVYFTENVRIKNRFVQEDLPCRAGSICNPEKQRVTEAKIGFIDTDLSEKGRKLISLASGRIRSIL